MATPTTLPATFVDGDILNASEMNALRGAFRVLQVVAGSTSTQVSNATATFTDTTLTATITPQSADSKILVLVLQNNLWKSSAFFDTRMDLRLLRGATQLVVFAHNILFTSSTVEQFQGSAGVMYLDTPATTSATTYKTQFNSVSGTSQVQVQSQGGCLSTIVLMEISA